MDDSVKHCEEIAAAMRKDIIELADVLEGKAGHWGGALSCVEILAVLFGEVMNLKTTDFAQKDKFLLSKGHASMALYTAMVETGLLNRELLQTYQKDGSRLSDLAVADSELGVECSGGSLGINLSMGAGLALLAKRKGYPYHTYVLVGDGELDEGSVWEAIMFASQQKLNNLVLIVDANGLQSDGSTKDILSWEHLADRLTAFGWETIETNGHDCREMLSIWENRYAGHLPRAIIAHTVKGKGISFMENDHTWHDRALSRDFLKQAKQEALCAC
ncbi:transketolase [Acutalibacter sp.]|jgi:transketolase|uniref:transketolase n=1 Tax=Acutalibacter sp. TaxID=1918636 RepID=UPI0021701DE8|nr:transketolase [Acutalibacter sp.]